MNLNQIAITPYVQGFIKVACELDPAFGERRTINDFVLTLRHHEEEAGQAKLATHPISEKLARKADEEDSDAGRVKEIPIKLFFNKAENALTIKYQAYRCVGNAPACSGDGKTAFCLSSAGDGTPTYTEIPCAGPEACPLVQSGEVKCNRQVRMAVQIDGQDDPLSVFEVRTSSLNTYKALRGQLLYLEKRFGGLRHIPLKLTLWQASNAASNYLPFSLMRLVLDAADEFDALRVASSTREKLKAAGLDDDVDAALAVPSSSGECPTEAVEFDAVSDFYERPARRAGTEAVRKGTVQPYLMAGDHGQTGSGAISRAVRQAGALGEAAAAP